MGGWESEGGGGWLGPIVWVRRRNGSWWPGKIMGPGELSECSLSSPRTGTPVKLLGREDASVDWYNLEKSKRVKAFRCGEFDDCIEKAESTHGMPVKKREKYARREDAILHALELEKQLLTDQVKVPVASDSLATKLSESGKKLPSIPEALGNNHGHIGNTRLPQASRVEVDVLDVTDASPLHSPGTRFSYKRTWEDERAEATPRMRGLQDLGPRTASLKRKYYPFESDISRRDNHLQVPFSSAPTVGKMSYTNGSEHMGAFVQAKRSRCIYFPNGTDNSFDGKECSFDQIRMLPQFEDSDFDGRRGSPKKDYSTSGVMEGEESNFSQSDSLGSESDSSETEQDTDDGTTASSESEPDALGHHEAPGDQESTSSEEPEDSPFSGDIAQLYPDDPYLSSEVVSKWPLKGKRNIRYVARDMTGNNGEYGRPSLGMYRAARTTGQRAYSGHDAHINGKYTGTQVAGTDNGFPPPFRFPRKDRNLIDWDDVTWEDGRHFFNTMFYGSHNFGGRPRSMLVDVDVKVRSCYPQERVPIISLLSKLNGRAIVGHHIQIEVLEDGSSASLIIPKDECHIGELALLDGSPTLTSSWKTARRSNYRVPHPHVSSVLDGDDSSNFPSPAEQDRKLPFKKSFVSSLGRNSSLLRPGPSHSPWPSLDRKFPRKSSKKVSLSSNQKTRTLSSIGSQHGFGTKSVHDTRGCQMDGLIKSETSGPTTVACIPVKLVFSRLLEKINRPPSKAVS